MNIIQENEHEDQSLDTQQDKLQIITEISKSHMSDSRKECQS